MTMKRIYVLLLMTLLVLVLVSCGGDSTPSETNIDVFCDVSQFANKTSAQIKTIMGEPNEVIEREAPYSGFAEIPCVYYEYTHEKYGEVLFCFVNDKVAKFTAYGNFPYYNDNTIKSLNCETGNAYNITETYQRFRCPTEEIDDIHISVIDDSTNTYASLQVTYDMMYFEEWYLPMSISEKTDYQIYTQNTVKSILKSPKSAVFPNINNWSFGKNNFYVVAQSYVDAQNSFGATIRSEFTFIYSVNSSTVLYAIFDGEVIANNGYIETESLIKALVAPNDSTNNENADSGNVGDDNLGGDNTEDNTGDDNTGNDNADGDNFGNNQSNNISELQSVVEQLCLEYNRDFAYYNSYINATVNSATSITVEQTIMDKIASDDEGIVEWLEEGLIAFFEEGLESAEFPQKIEIIVSSIYEIDESSGLLNAEYIDMYELQELSGNESLWFGTMASSYENYNLGIGNLVFGFYTSGIFSTELLFIYDMPEEFAQEYNNEGVYSGIHFCIVEDMWCFNPKDLISVGLLNADGSFNEEFEPQAFDESKAKKEWDSDWISDSQLKSIYDYSWIWIGETAYLHNYYLNTKYTITGTPASSFGNDVVHSCSCNGFTVRVKYLNGDYLFFYDDLVQAVIIA